VRILVVSVSFPAPARSGGERRLAALLGGLCDRHEVGIVALRRTEPDPAFAQRFSLVDLVEPLPPRKPLPFPLGALRAWSGVLFGALPGFARGSGTPAFAAAVQRAIDTFRPDVAYVEPVDVAHVIPALARRGVPVCFGAIELVTAKTRRWLELTTSRKHRVAGLRELQRTRRLEERALRAAAAIVCVSEEDHAAIHAWTGRGAVVAPNGVDTEYFSPRADAKRDALRVLMLGPLSYAANLDALEWFAAHVLPKVNGVGVDVVGRPATMPLDFGERVRLLGAVDDVRPHLASAAALVAPLRIAGGTRLKILEAMAMETPVVTTTIGAEGLNVRDAEHVLIADDAEAFARAVTRVASDADLAARLSRAGRELVVRDHGWARSVDAVEDALARIAQPASRAASP
jgi:glycosyltransferase involved in cell wall biosynthesis